MYLRLFMTLHAMSIILKNILSWMLLQLLAVYTPYLSSFLIYRLANKIIKISSEFYINFINYEGKASICRCKSIKLKDGLFHLYLC